MPRKTCVVIGSNCFTGSHIVDGLLADRQTRVVGISRSPEYPEWFLPYKKRIGANFEFRQIDLVREFDRITALLDDLKPQVVINVAALSEVALSNDSPVEYFETNTAAVVRLCHYLRGCAQLERYVHISSAEIFGSCETAAAEDRLFKPSTPYAASKAAADLYLNTAIRNVGFPATIIRSTNVYGPCQQLYKIIPRTIIYLRLRRTLELHGGGTSVKSFIHVRDVVGGVQLAIERGGPGAYHFSVPSAQTVADIVRGLCVRMGYEFERVTRVVPERPGQDARYWLDCAKAHRDLGWQPEVSFGAGLDEVVAWVDANWNRLMQGPLVYVHRE